MLQTVVRLPLANISSGGALFESCVPLSVETVHRMTFECNGTESTTDIRVRHIRHEQTSDGEVKYFIGVEFLSVSPALAQQIQQWIASGKPDAALEI
jgi:c-di-GMP-binding flagellar brake protein YcgR